MSFVNPSTYDMSCCISLFATNNLWSSMYSKFLILLFVLMLYRWFGWGCLRGTWGPNRTTVVTMNLLGKPLFMIILLVLRYPFLWVNSISVLQLSTDCFVMLVLLILLTLQTLTILEWGTLFKCFSVIYPGWNFFCGFSHVPSPFCFSWVDPYAPCCSFRTPFVLQAWCFFPVGHRFCWRRYIS